MLSKKFQRVSLACAVALLLSVFVIGNKKSFGDTSDFGTHGDVQASMTIVGMDQDRSSVVKTVPRVAFQESLGAALTAIHQSILPTLNQTFEGSSTLSCSQTATEGSEWSLRTVGVGVGMSAKVGLGPIWNVSLAPRVRLIFTNSTNPVYPD